MVKRGPRLKSKRERARDIELEAIIDEMGFAMRLAYVPYVAEYAKSTFHMETALEQFYRWAREYVDIA